MVPPERETDYPEPERLGPMPAHGFYVRHARNVEFFDVQARTVADDGRPPFVLDDVDGVDFLGIKASHTGSFMKLTNVKDLRARMVDGVKDVAKRSVAKGKV